MSFKMKSYLEIYVPFNSQDRWFTKLKQDFNCVDVWWQNGFYHITIAFIDDLPETVDIVPIIDEYFRDVSSYNITLDCIEAFTASNGMHMICLKPSKIPNDFIDMATEVRKEIINAGCIVSSEFIPHVTIGRVNGNSIKLSDLQAYLSTLSVPSFSMELSYIDYRIFKGNALFEKMLNCDVS